jgi:hypothetical protein
MAVYLALRHKVTGETYSGGKLVAVDEMLRAALGAEPDPVNWFAHWMDWVGFSIAYRFDKPIADTLAEMRDNARDDERRIVDWFIDTFDNVSFSGR